MTVSGIPSGRFIALQVPRHSGRPEAFTRITRMFLPTKKPVLPILAAGLIALGVRVQAAPIAFSAADFLDEAQISTTGTLVEAVNFGTGSTNQVLNGITFTAAAASSANLAVQNGTANSNTLNYNDAIHTITGVTVAEGNALFDVFVFGNGTGSDLVTLSGLSVGVQYEFQVLFVDDRTTNSIPSRTMTVSPIGGSPIDGTGPLDYTSSNVQLVTGTFTADAATQGFDISDSAGDNVKINAYQLRSLSPPPPPGPVKVFLLGGQSNMLGGSTDENDLPVGLQGEQTDVLFYHNGLSALGNLQPGSGSTAIAFGPEITFGRTVADTYANDSFALIKYAKGGTDLENDWDPATGAEYTTFREVVTQGLAKLTEAGHEVEIVGMLWTQGERDAKQGFEAAYETNLTNFIADIRSRYGADLPFFISQLSSQQTDIPAAPLAQVRQAQANVAAADPDSHLIVTDTYGMQADNLHFTSAGQMALGDGFADAYQAMRSTPANLASMPTNSSVALDWDDNEESDFDAYLIYRKVGSGNFVLIATRSAAQSSFIDYGFDTSQDHTYRVTARDTAGNESLPAEITVAAVTPPGTLDFSPTTTANRPNIILFMADDQGWGDAGYNGHPLLQTPVLNEMAANGYVFNRFYAAAPVCSPTRASVLSGRSPLRSKVPNHGRYMRSHQEATLPRALKAAGYVTGMFGKSHIGSGQPDSPVNPSGMGFDEWVIGLNYFDNNPYLSRNGTVEHRTGETGSVAVVDDTIAFLDAHKGGNQPMFVMTWVPAPHSPHLELSSNPSLYNGDPNQGYFQEITLLDEQLGRLRQWLRDQHLEQNTLLWFCSDNGGLLAESSGGRDKKGDTWEGGLRVPGIIEWPARNLTGSTNVPAVTSDIYPTLLALTGTSVAEQPPLDGIDLRSVIEGSQPSRPAIGFWHDFQDGQSTLSDDILSAIMTKQLAGDPLPHDPARIKKDVDEFPQFAENASAGVSAWLDWPWKLHRRSATNYQLYNLETDPLEASNLAGDPAQAQRLNDMKNSLHAWQSSVMRSLNGADYAQAPLWLPLNRTSGTEVFDANGSKRGDLLGFPDATSHWVAGKHNRAVAFDGSNDLADLANTYFFPPVGANARTVTAWIKTTGSGTIAEWGNSSTSGAAWTLELDPGGRLKLDVGGGSITGQTDLRSGTWRHIAVVLPNDGSPNVTEATLYVDGAAETPSASSSRAIRTDNSAVTLGGARTGAAEISIDEFRIFPRALDASEVLAQFTATAQAGAAWHYQNFGTEGPIDWQADDDHDGRELILEYAIGSDPKLNDAGSPLFSTIINSETDRVEATFNRRKPGTHDLDHALEFSDDLVSWLLPFTEILVLDHPQLDPGLFDQVTIESVPTLEELGRMFVRMTATSP